MTRLGCPGSMPAAPAAGRLQAQGYVTPPEEVPTNHPSFFILERGGELDGYS
jgi:hypothetical protein